MASVRQSDLLTAVDEAHALEAMHAAGQTDGLPVVVPTPERVARMITQSGLDGDLSLGAVGPNLGAATIEKVCIAAVMAGCLPDHLPIVLASVTAVCDERLDTTEWQATTHAISPLIIVNGPARSACGNIAGSFGALGPGHRANASIGRAVRLVLLNIGGARPGVSDMALLGHGAKFGAVLAELEEDSPWPPLHTSLGFAASDSTVLVVGTEPPHSVMSVGDADDPSAPDRLLDSLAATIANVGSNNAYFRRGTVVVAINPDHAAALAKAGYDRSAVQLALHERAANSWSRLRALNPTFAGPGTADTIIRATARPEDILVIVAGGGGIYSAVFPSWGAGPHANPYVVVHVALDQACEVPPARRIGVASERDERRAISSRRPNHPSSNRSSPRHGGGGERRS